MVIRPGFNFGNGVFSPLGAKASGGAKLQALGTNSPKMRQYMRDVTNTLKRLGEAVGCVKATNVFMGPQSTDSFAVALSYTGSKFDSFDDIAMSVEQEARTRQTMGFAQDVNGADYAAGTHTFALEVNGKSHEFTIEVAAGETNASVQKKMAAAVNGAGLDVTASITTHADRGVTLSTLAFESKAMGDDAADFTLRDTGGTLVRTSGANHLAHEAQNARYTVNGVAHTGTSNTVELGNGITATIRGASRGGFTITDGYNEINAGNVRSILYAPLNDLKTIATAMEKETGNGALLLKISSLFAQTESALGQFGVVVGTNGLFDIDESRATGNLRSYLQGYYQHGGGFIAYLEAFAASGLQNPGALFSGLSPLDKNV